VAAETPSDVLDLEHGVSWVRERRALSRAGRPRIMRATR
jgi:hypothetical protein